MALIDLFGTSFFNGIEKDVIASVGVSLSRNRKIVTARTIKSVRAVTTYNENSIEFEIYGGEGMPYIMTDKPANTKYPLDFKGTAIGKNGKTLKIFELKPYLKDWKAIVGFKGSDFILARAIAKKERKAINISTIAIEYLSEKIGPKILSKFSRLLAVEIQTKFENKE